MAAFRAGYVPPRDLLWDAVAAVSFVLRGATDEGSAALRERILWVVAGHPAADFTALSEVFVPKLVASVLPEARELLAEHGSAGHDRFVVSASPVGIVRPLAEQLGLEGAVGTRSQINQDGLYTGALAGPFCYQEGKADEIRLLAAERGYDLADCNAYSDSIMISDLPFLEAVGHPVAVNPDRALREKAHRSGWPIVDVAPAKGYAVFGLPRRLLTLARLGAGGRV